MINGCGLKQWYTGDYGGSWTNSELGRDAVTSGVDLYTITTISKGATPVSYISSVSDNSAWSTVSNKNYRHNQVITITGQTSSRTATAYVKTTETTGTTSTNGYIGKLTLLGQTGYANDGYEDISSVSGGSGTGTGCASGPTSI